MSFIASAAIRSPAPGEAERWMLVPDAEHSGKTNIVEPVSRGDEADAIGDDRWVPTASHSIGTQCHRQECWWGSLGLLPRYSALVPETQASK